MQGSTGAVRHAAASRTRYAVAVPIAQHVSLGAQPSAVVTSVSGWPQSALRRDAHVPDVGSQLGESQGMSPYVMVSSPIGI